MKNLNSYDEYEEIRTPQDLDSFMDTCIDRAQKKQSRCLLRAMEATALPCCPYGYLDCAEPGCGVCPKRIRGSLLVMSPVFCACENIKENQK